ncbi:MAG: hypothetical protein HWE25_05420 [Alphaproteobacteria bacterium]|nr:hypothetical protein [Alphaproteobacteria bacterium]
METELLQTPTHHYNEELVQNVFDIARENMVKNKQQALILSEERIPATYALGGVSYEERMVRLKKVMPEDTTVLMVVRNPVKYLRSYYRYRMAYRGLPIDYADFVKYELLKGGRSFLGTTDYCGIANVASKHFSDVKIICFEELVENQMALHEALAASGIYITESLGKENAGLSEAASYHMLNLLREQGNAINGNSFISYEPCDIYTMEDNSPMFESLFLREQMRLSAMNTLRNASVRLAQAQPDVQLDYTLDAQTEDMFMTFVKSVNQRLAATYGLDLQKYGYDL